MSNLYTRSFIREARELERAIKKAKKLNLKLVYTATIKPGDILYFSEPFRSFSKSNEFLIYYNRIKPGEEGLYLKINKIVKAPEYSGWARPYAFTSSVPDRKKYIIRLYTKHYYWRKEQ